MKNIHPRERVEGEGNNDCLNLVHLYLPKLNIYEFLVAFIYCLLSYLCIFWTDIKKKDYVC